MIFKHLRLVRRTLCLRNPLLCYACYNDDFEFKRTVANDTSMVCDRISILVLRYKVFLVH